MSDESPIVSQAKRSRLVIELKFQDKYGHDKYVFGPLPNERIVEWGSIPSGCLACVWATFQSTDEKNPVSRKYMKFIAADAIHSIERVEVDVI